MIALMSSQHGLKHQRILLTRSVEHLPALEAQVVARGAVPVLLPCLAVQWCDAAIKQAGASFSSYSDVVFTSSNGVHAVAGCIADGLDLRSLCAGKRIAAVGRKTADALQAYGVTADIVPDLASQDGLIAAYIERGLPGSLLFFRAVEGRESLAKALQQQGVKVKMVVAYRTVCPQDDAADVIHRMQQHEIDAVLLGSAKTARFYIQRMGSLKLADQTVLVAISESLAVALRKMGLSVQVVAKQASFEAMLDALAEYFDSLALTSDRSV